MHRVLQIPELVELVCSQIPSVYSAGDHGVSGRHDLAILARTAKIFLNPALDNLWSAQYTLAHILRCMPVGLWTEPMPARGSMYGLELARPVMPSDWERPSFYLPRVKNLDFSEDSYLPSGDILEILAFCHPEPLFPNLRSLAWSYVDSGLFPYIHIFLGPRLWKLEINIPSTVAHLSILPTIARKCPSLAIAEICYDAIATLAGFHEHIRTALSFFVRGLQRIETLRVHDLNGSAFEYLATIPMLKELMVDNLNEFASLPPSYHPRFPSLTRLGLWPRTLEVAISCITSLSPPELAHLMVTCTVTSLRLSAIASLYRVVQQTLPQAFLSSLYINIYSFDDSAVLSDSWMAKHALLHTLFYFPHLTSLSLQIPGGFDLDDASALDIARAWPNLRDLDLIPDDVVPGERRTTLAALCIFAENFPELESLAIEFNALTLPAQNPDKLTFHTRLTNLRVGHSPIVDPIVVAGFMSSVFPQLSELCPREEDGLGWGEDASHFHDRWETVVKALTQHSVLRPSLKI
ncbi:hypothetical protein DFH06DRAFT_1488459 [Mycena polygramma]|nr:hypothetical protein DFH06DRAFT_1488459 [Mycena polygramma]